MGAKINKVPENLIQLLRINQQAIVVMDSDRSKPRQRLATTKLRVQEECEKSGAFCWVTYRREIENYLPSTVLSKTCERIRGQGVSPRPKRYGRLESALDGALGRANLKVMHYEKNKVGLAREFIKDFHQDDMGPDLRRTINRVVKQIETWNE